MIFGVLNPEKIWDQ